MRIALMGASGTGKTRISSYISEKYGLPICPIGSRSVTKSMGLHNPYDVDAAGLRREFQARLFEEKRFWEDEHEAFVTDRTPYDNLAYATMHGCAQTLCSVELDAYVAAMARYSTIFYVPLRRFQNLGNDPYRVKFEGYHVLFDILLRALLDSHDFGVSYVSLDCALDDREYMIDDVIARSRYVD